MSFAYMTGDTAGHWCVVLFYRGHYGLVVKTPEGWRIQQRTSKLLWHSSEPVGGWQT